MTPTQALQLLVEAIDAQKASSDGGPFVKLDWIELELTDARDALAAAAAEFPPCPIDDGTDHPLSAHAERVTRVRA